MGLKVTALAKQSMVLSLFLIGCNVERSDVKKLSPRPFVLGLLLWISVSVGTLWAILGGWIRST